jgi:hypothetical protein
MARKKTLRHAGEVTSVSAHHANAKLATVHVAHGTRTKPKPAKDGSIASDYDDRPQSSVVMPKGKAKGFTFGQRVHVGLTADQDEEHEDLDQMDARLRKARRS